MYNRNEHKIKSEAKNIYDNKFPTRIFIIKIQYNDLKT